MKRYNNALWLYIDETIHTHREREEKKTTKKKKFMISLVKTETGINYILHLYISFLFYFFNFYFSVNSMKT